jgi:phage shock protein E
MKPRRHFILSIVFLLACAGAPPRQTADNAPAGKVGGPTAKRLVAAGARLVDVRSPGFYATEHIEGAINIPVAEIASRAAADIGPTTTPVVLYCRTGAGSARAAVTLASLGYQRVYDLGPYLNWGEGAPAPTPLPTALNPQCPEGK